MNWFQTISVLLCLCAVFSYINVRWLKLPMTIGVMLIALCVSLSLNVLDLFGIQLDDWAREMLFRLDFSETLLEGMLSFLLFAGALHVNLNDLTKEKGFVALLATVGVALSTVLIGGSIYLVSGWLGIYLPFSYALLFGALISPTDPIAVLATLKTVKVPKSLY